MTAAVFFDRDGTLMRDADYCDDPANVKVFEGAADAIRQLKGQGFKIVVVTNQSGIGRGYMTEEDYRAVAREFESQLGSRPHRRDILLSAFPGGFMCLSKTRTRNAAAGG